MDHIIEKFKDKGKFINNNEITEIVTAFIDAHPAKIGYQCKRAYGDTNSVSLASFKEVIKEDLEKSVISFINGGHSFDKIKRYLLSCVKVSAIKLSSVNRHNTFICPACSFNGTINHLSAYGKRFTCYVCTESSSSGDFNQEIIEMCKVFADHSRKGYRCEDCNNFIPKQDEGVSIVSCPFPNCCFSGDVSKLDVMQHPKIRTNVEISILDAGDNRNHGRGGSVKDIISENNRDNIFRFRSGASATITSPTGIGLSIEQSASENYNILMTVIDNQRLQLQFNSNGATMKHKVLMYNAYINIIEKYPEEMISYLVFQNRNGGMQHKIFQEYANLLESALPYTYLKGGTPVVIDSLLDNNLCVFDGVSEFNAEVLHKGEIENKTTELYVGGRKGFYCKPFYIGKLLEVTDSVTGESLMDKVKEYSFFKIEMNSTVPVGTQVFVKHLRIPPHYQMGGMVYLNRIRRKIVDKVYKTIHGVERKPSR